MMTQLGYSLDALMQRMWRAQKLVYSPHNFLPTHHLHCTGASEILLFPSWSLNPISRCSTTGSVFCTQYSEVCPPGVELCYCITILSANSQLGLNTENTEWGCSEAEGLGWEAEAGKEWNCGNIGKTWPDSQRRHSGHQDIRRNARAEATLASY